MVSTHLKNMLVQLDHLPRDRGKNIKYEWNRHLEDDHLAIPCKTAILFRRVSVSFQVPPIAHLREYVGNIPQSALIEVKCQPSYPSYFWPFLGAGPQLPMSLPIKNNEAARNELPPLDVDGPSDVNHTPWKINGWNLQPSPMKKKGKWSAKSPGKYVPAVNLHGCTFIISIPCISWIWL